MNSGRFARRVGGTALTIAAAMSAVGCQSGAAAPTAPRGPAVHIEYAEVRWQVGPTTRSVTVEKPGDRFRGTTFSDALEHLKLPRPTPSNTAMPTSSDLLTALSADDWELVSHTMTWDDVAFDSTRVDPSGVTVVSPSAGAHVEVWTLRRRVP